MVEDEARVVNSRAFSAYGRTLEMVLYFKYMRRVLSEANDDWPVVIRNLTKARLFLRISLMILIREGARLRMYVFFFKAIV